MNDLRKWIDAINQEPQEVIEEITLEDEQDFHDEFGFLAFSEDENDMFEAEYQGRTVKLNKPMQGDVKKSIMIGDSETDAESAKAAKIPFILLEDGYTDKKVSEIHHDYLIKNFDGIEEIINKYLID